MDNTASIFYSFFIAIWTVVFIEFWKREQYKLQFEWDTISYQGENEKIRTEFENKALKKLNKITGV